MSINPIANNKLSTTQSEQAELVRKNTQIKATLRATKERRSSKRCRTINLKIQHRANKPSIRMQQAIHCL